MFKQFGISFLFVFRIRCLVIQQLFWLLSNNQANRFVICLINDKKKAKSLDQIYNAHGLLLKTKKKLGHEVPSEIAHVIA